MYKILTTEGLASVFFSVYQKEKTPGMEREKKKEGEERTGGNGMGSREYKK